MRRPGEEPGVKELQNIFRKKTGVGAKKAPENPKHTQTRSTEENPRPLPPVI